MLLFSYIALLAISLGIGSKFDHDDKLGEPITEPMFGLDLQFGDMHYDAVPAAARSACKLPSGRGWTFAHARRNATDYYIVLVQPPNQDGDAFGSALAVTGDKCKSSEAKWALSGRIPSTAYPETAPALTLPGEAAAELCTAGPTGECHYVLRSAAEERLLRDLVLDGIARGVRALGAPRFKQKACSDDILDANTAIQIVKEELTKVCAK